MKKPDPSPTLLTDRLESSGYNLPALLKEHPVCVIAIRGLFANTYGKPDANDINCYDDALYVARYSQEPGTKNQEQLVVTSYNANTDPTRYGWNPGAGKYMARLKPGKYKMRRRRHGASRPGGGYMAYGQDGSEVTVERIDENGKVRKTETGDYGIDLHPGGQTTTSSEGCQTIPREQWDSLDNLLQSLTSKNWFHYILLDRTDLPQDLR